MTYYNLMGMNTFIKDSYNNYGDPSQLEKNKAEQEAESLKDQKMWYKRQKKALKLAKKYKKLWEKEYMKYCFQSSFYDYGLNRNGPIMIDPYECGQFYNGSTVINDPSGSHTLAPTFGY